MKKIIIHICTQHVITPIIVNFSITYMKFVASSSNCHDFLHVTVNEVFFFFFKSDSFNTTYLGECVELYTKGNVQNESYMFPVILSHTHTLEQGADPCHATVPYTEQQQTSYYLLHPICMIMMDPVRYSKLGFRFSTSLLDKTPN